MTTLTAAREAIYQAFVDGWGATSVFTFDNENFDPPDDASWVRLSVRHNASTQETLGRTGNRRFARLGSALVQIFTRDNIGARTADTLATTAREIFEGVSLAGTTIRFLDVIVRETGPDGKWYQVVVEATFEYDETR